VNSGELLLVLDVGNTHTVLGVFRDEELLGHWRITSEHHRTPVEVGILLRSLFELATIDLNRIRGVALSSVVPALTPVFQEVARDYLHHEAMVVGPGIRTGVPILVDNPREVGADRIVNAVAAYRQVHKACIVAGGICSSTRTTWRASVFSS
jgi:type III pantothenate kinase